MSASKNTTRSAPVAKRGHPNKRQTAASRGASRPKIKVAAAKASKPAFSHYRSSVPNPKQPIMISCFDESGIMAKPWADAGYLCYTVDLQHPRGETRQGNIVRVGMNMLDWLPPKGDIRFDAYLPPCSHMA